MSQRILTWSDVDALLEHLLPQMMGTFDVMVMISRGGIIPGGLIAERLGISQLCVASVAFPAPDTDEGRVTLFDKARQDYSSVSLPADYHMGSMPVFVHFPPDELIQEKRVLIVNHVWNHGRTINAVAGRLVVSGGRPALCVLHYKPTFSLFPKARPDFYAAITDEYVIYPWEAAHRTEPYRPGTLWR